MQKQRVKVLAASISSISNIHLWTFELRYWRGIHSELMTHRALSKNAGSSRARPIKGIRKQVWNDPWGPSHWGFNQPGMQANQEATGLRRWIGRKVWGLGAKAAVIVSYVLEKLGFHKQLVNRVLEPFTYIDVVLTGTDFNNFFALRDDNGAQPEFRELAREMKVQMSLFTPQVLKPGEWHLPYILDEDYAGITAYLSETLKPTAIISKRTVLEALLKVSAARCARVSYRAFDGTIDYAKDIARYQSLVEDRPVHASPTEHQATPLNEFKLYTKDSITPDNPYAEEREFTFYGEPDCWSNLRGWLQYRKTIPENVIPG